MSHFTAVGNGMREVRAVNFSKGYNYHRNEPAIINPNSQPINVSQQPNVVPLMIQTQPIVPNYMAVQGGRQTQQTNAIWVCSADYTQYELPPITRKRKGHIPIVAYGDA